MTQHSTRAASTLPSNSLWGRLLKRPWPAQLVLVAALLLAVPFLFHAGSTVHAADNEISGVTLTSPNPGELAITWDAPSRAPSDYRVTWKKSDGKWPSYKNENTALGGNAFPTGTSHTVSDLDEGTEYSVRVRARYHDGGGNITESGPWSDPPMGLTIAGLPDKPTGLSASPSHDSVLLSWTDPGDGTVTSYQVLRGPNADNLAVLADNTGGAATSYTDSTVAAETTYVYAIRARNAHGLGPQSGAVSTTTPAAPALPAKPTITAQSSTHSRAFLFWADPGDDSITGYQILRGLAADTLTVLVGDTGNTDTRYTDETVEPETQYFYAIRARNAVGLSPQSNTVSTTTQPAPAGFPDGPVFPDDPVIVLDTIAGVDFIIAGQMMDTTGTCSEGDIALIGDDCTHDITNPMPQFGVVGTLGSNAGVAVRIGRNFMTSTEVADESDLQGENKRITPTFQPGRNILSIWGDEDDRDTDGVEQYFFRINVLPYWEWNGERLSKDSDCRDTTADAPAVGEITDDDCIVTQFGNTAELRFFNVTKEHFNVYVEVNETNVINEPSTTDLGNSFTVNLDAGDNLIRIRLASKGGTVGETYDSDSFYYKVTATDVLASNLGKSRVEDYTITSTNTAAAVQIITGNHPDGYEIDKVHLRITVPSGTTPKVSFYSEEGDIEPMSSLKVLDNPLTIPTSRSVVEFGANDYKLNASTPYWVVIERATGTGEIEVSLTANTGLDAGSAPGWRTLGNGFYLESGTWGDPHVDDRNPQFAVKGALSTVSTDATLSGLLLDSTLAPTSISLTPAFDSEVTEYTATFANQYSDAAFQVTTNDDNATVEFLDENDATIPTTGTTPPNIHYLESNLDVGDTVFKVKVTAEDGTTMKTYEVTVTRVDFLVSNLGQVDFGAFGAISLHSIGSFIESAVQFTTSGNTGGYRISGVGLNIVVVTGTSPSVSIYSDISGRPGTSLKVLTNPADILSVTQMQYDGFDYTLRTSDFSADNYKLEADTKYWVVIGRASGSGEIVLVVADSSAEDPGTAPRWSIGDTALTRTDTQTWPDAASATSIIVVAIKGEPSPPVSDDATLSALALTDTDNKAITLDPTFASGVESYTATVANAVSQIKVEPTRNDATASIEYLDGDDMVLTDADATTTGVFDVDLAEGENVIKVEVTSSDAMTKTTYTVRVRRTAADDLVSNLGQPDNGVIVIFPNAVFAMQFTTGTKIAGYTVSGVVVNIVSNASGTFAFAIHETDSTGAFDVSGNKVVDLTGSPTMLGEHTFIPATTTRLDPSTEYFIVITKTSGSATEIQATQSEQEDLVAETGWTIEDSVFSSNSGSTWAVASARTPEFAVKGEPITPVITLAADFTSIVRELHEVTFTLTRAGSTALAATVTLVLENATGDSVVSASGQRETLTFQVGDDTVEFAVPLFWTRSSQAGSFVATVQAGAEYDVSAATATVEVVYPTALIEVSLDQNSYDVTEGDDLTLNLVFNVLEEIAAPNKDFATSLSVTTSQDTAKVNDDYKNLFLSPTIPASSWSLVADRYVATLPLTVETVEDALYERPTGSQESLEINLQSGGGTPTWVTLKGPTTGTTSYPVTIRDNETLNLNAELSSTGLTSGANLRIDEDAGEDVTLTVTNTGLASDGNPVTLPPGVKLKITPDIPTNRGATETDDWTISPDEIDLGGTATITIIDDMLEEGPESVTFKVGFDDDEMFQSARATLTINDDEYTGPVLQSAAINGRELTLEFSNTLDATSRPAASSFVVKVRGTAVSLSSSNPVSISGSTVTLRLRSPVTAGDTVTVSYTAPGANPIKDDAALEAPSFTEEPVTNNTPNAPATGKPVISGTPQRDETLTVSTSSIRDDDGLSNPQFSYRWLRVDGETETLLYLRATYLLTRDDIGKKIKVIVTFRDDAGKVESLESDLFPRSGTIQNKPNRQPTGRPTLSGTYQVGHTLTADTSGIGDRDGLTNPGYTYQWQRWESGVYTDISGADSMVYTLTADDEGKRVRAQVTFTDDDDNSHTLESFPSGVVQAQTSLPSDKVKVSLDATAYVVEEGDTVQVTVTLAEAPDEGPVNIGFTVTPGNGATQADFTAGSTFTRQLRFDAGETTDRINIRADDDTLNDDGETITLCLDDLPDPYATLAGLNCATVNIMDNDDPNSVQVSFDRGNYWASEDGNPAWPRISVHPVPDRKITIPITITRGGGLSAADHGVVTTRVTFGPGRYGVHGDGHLSDNRTYASFPIEIWAIDDRHDDDDEYLDLTFGALPPFVTKDTGYRLGGDSRAGFRRPADQSRVWFNDNEFTQVQVTDPPNPLGFSKRMRVTFADAELEAKEGLYEIGTVATVRVQLSRPRNKESTVTIPITVTRHGTATAADYTRADIPSSITFLPGQTEYSFRVRAVNDDIDDDGEYLTLSFGRLPDLVIAGDQATTRVNLVDDDDPPVDVFFEHANYEVTSVSQDGNAEYARLNIKVKLSAAPERFIDVGIVAESTQGGGRIHLGSSAYVPRGPHSGAAFDADETEFTVTVVMSATDGFDPNQRYRLRFEGMSDRVSVGSPATATITINANP